MRRREKPDAAPRQIRRFRSEDWPEGCHPECSFWRAVFAWLDEHPDQDVDVVDGPDVPWHEGEI